MRIISARRIMKLPALLCLAAGMAGCAPQKTRPPAQAPSREIVQPHNRVEPPLVEMAEFNGLEMIKSEYDCLRRLMEANGLSLEQVVLDPDRDRMKVLGPDVKPVVFVDITAGHVVFLDLTFTPIKDISALSGFSLLDKLKLGFTSISDISPLKGLERLSFLSLEYAPVSDISALSGLSNLEVLRLSGTQVSDLSPLGGLSKLRSLGLIQTPVSNLSPLMRLGNLRELYLKDTRAGAAAIAELQRVNSGLKIYQ